jgi:hypothetical protein
VLSGAWYEFADAALQIPASADADAALQMPAADAAAALQIAQLNGR